jgi:hypothetical protein
MADFPDMGVEEPAFPLQSVTVPAHQKSRKKTPLDAGTSAVFSRYRSFLQVLKTCRKFWQSGRKWQKDSRGELTCRKRGCLLKRGFGEGRSG